jgi:hypothetical protein
MPTILCARCGTLIATVRDTRFGLLPPASYCVSCSLPKVARRLTTGH